MATVDYDPNGQYEVDEQEIEYLNVDGTPFLARILQPRGKGPFPILLYVHGGAWTAGSRMGNAWAYEPLAPSGVVVVAIDFRLAPSYPYPEPLVDINYGIRWTKAHAADFNADASTLGALGSSSGGHQSLMNALRPRDPRYTSRPLPEAPDLDASLRYVVGCWPITDPLARYLFAQDTNRMDLMTKTEGYFRSQEAMQEGNPLMILERGEPVELPPVIIVQGTADINVTPDIQRRFAAAYQSRGGSCELHVFQDMPHGTTQWPDAEAAEAMSYIKNFIACQLQPA
jgi:acetyl esterase